MKNKQTQHHEKGWERGRITSLSDGVFSFSITLLVINLLSISFPSGNQPLFPTLAANWPIFLSYFISFIVVGRYWMAHARLFQNIQDFDGTLFNLNLLLLFFIAVLPFPTEILGTHINDRDAIIFYAFMLACTGFAEYAIGFHAYHHHKLMRQNQSEKFLKVFNFIYLGTPIIFLVSIAVALWSPSAAEILWILIVFIKIMSRGAIGKKNSAEMAKL